MTDTVTITVQNNSETVTLTVDETGTRGLTGALLAGNNLSDVLSAVSARSNLGIVIGTDVQAYDAVLDSTTASFTTDLKNSYDTAFGWGDHSAAGYATASNLALKVAIADIENILTSTNTNTPLSAAMGKSLKDSITTIETVLLSDTDTLDTIQEVVDFIELNRSDLDALGISAIAGLQTALDGKQPLTSILTATTASFTTAQETKLSNTSGTNTGDQSKASLGLVIGTDVQAYDTVLNNTTASFTTGEETKLSGIETGADVTANATGTASGLTAGNVTTNANLTGHVTSTGNAAVLGSFTAAQLNTAVSDASLLASGGALGTPSSGTATNLTGTASSLTAGNVTTNANLTGIVTSTGNATAIANKAIALAKLADGTDGELITWNASGVAATIAAGTADQVLTSNGAGAAATFQDAGGGGGSSPFEFVSLANITTSTSTVDIALPSGYNMFQIRFYLYSALDAHLKMVFSEDSGSTYLVSEYIQYGYNNTYTGSTSWGYEGLISPQRGIHNAGHIDIYNASASTNTMFTSHSTVLDPSYIHTGSGLSTSQTARINTVQLRASGAYVWNLGKFALYGIKES
jgi:hypothetical protein